MLSVAVGIAAPATAAATPDEPASPGEHGSSCAYTHLPPLSSPPANACENGGS